MDTKQPSTSMYKLYRLNFIVLALSGFVSAPSFAASSCAKIEIKVQPQKQPFSQKTVRLTLRGEATDGLKVVLRQHNMVFFEQIMKKGPFFIDDIEPINNFAKVKMTLHPEVPSKISAEVPLKLKERRSVVAKPLQKQPYIFDVNCKSVEVISLQILNPGDADLNASGSDMSGNRNIVALNPSNSPSLASAQNNDPRRSPLNTGRSKTIINKAWGDATVSAIDFNDTPLAPIPNIAKPDTEFDPDFLKGNTFKNLTNDDIKNFGKAKPGFYFSDIFRNDTYITRDNVQIKPADNGNAVQACITPSLFTRLGVIPKYITAQGKSLLASSSNGMTAVSNPVNSAECMPIESWVPGSSAKFNLSEMRLDVMIPQAYLTSGSRYAYPKELLTPGENAGFLKYGFNHFRLNGSGIKQSSNFLALDGGFNVDFWQFRHSGTMNNSSLNGTKYLANETFVRRPLIDLESVAALGDISTFSPILGGMQMRGLRLTSEEGMMDESEKRNTPVVRGVARSNAKVTVKQNQSVLLEQNVPPGPFEFKEIYPMTSYGDLLVTVTESDGTSQSFVIPFNINAQKLNQGSWRYSAASGVYRNSTRATGKFFVQGYVKYGLTDELSPSVEAILGSGYMNLGTSIGLYQGLGSLSTNFALSHYSASPNSKNGNLFGLYYSTPSSGLLGFYGGFSRQSRSYTAPSVGLASSGTLASPLLTAGIRNRLYAGAFVNLQQAGNVYVNLSNQDFWDSSLRSSQIRLGYGVQISRINLDTYFDRYNFSNAQSYSIWSLAATVPFSTDFTNAISRTGISFAKGAGSTLSSSVSGTTLENNNLNYNLYGSKSANRDIVFGSSASYQHPYGYATASAAIGKPLRQLGFGFGGGALVHDQGLILGPQMSDTMAYVEVPNGEGLGIVGHISRINGSGHGLVPYVIPYALNDVDLNLSKAPLGFEVDNTNQKVAPVEGAIVKLNYKSSVGRPLLIQLKLPNGQNIPIGSSILDDANNILGFVGQGSRADLRVQRDQGKLKAVWGETTQQSCEFSFNLQNALQMTSGYSVLKVPCEMSSKPLAKTNR